MNTQITVDADLLKQAMQITHVQNSQILIERFLQSIIQNSKLEQTRSQADFEQLSSQLTETFSNYANAQTLSTYALTRESFYKDERF
jgi:hypothetical protein